MNSIQNKIEILKQKSSQWEVKKEIGCICKEKYVQRTHIHDAEKMDGL